MIETRRFAYFDNDRHYHEVQQVWARIPATGVWMIVSARPIAIDPDAIPACPVR